jgi:hypothetical protein
MFSPMNENNARFKSSINGIFSTRNSYQSSDYTGFNNGSTRIKIKSSFEHPAKEIQFSSVTPKVSTSFFSSRLDGGNAKSRYSGAPNVGKSIDFSSSFGNNKTLLRHNIANTNTMESTRKSVVMPKLKQFGHQTPKPN